MEQPEAVQLVESWLTALNTQDIDRLLALSSAQIEVVGPRGVGHGHQLLREWLARAGLHLSTVRLFARDNRVVVAQRAVWHAPETGAVAGQAEVASRFLVVQGQVGQYARHEDLDSALGEAGLTYADEQAPTTVSGG